MDPTESDNHFQGERRPLLAAVATNAARPSAGAWIVGVVGVLTALACGLADGRGRGTIALTVSSLAAIVAAIAGPTMSAQQVFADRQSGALDQHRLAGRGPWEMLIAYTVGPSWSLTLAVWLSALAASLCALDAGPWDRAMFWVPLGVAAGVTVGSFAWALNGVALALGIDRNLPITQASGVGLLAPILRLPLFGLVVAATRDRGWGALIGLEILLLALSARFALRRFACEEDDADVPRARYAGVGAASAIAAALGAAHAHENPHGLAFPVVCAVALTGLTAALYAPARGAMFRAWVARGDAAEGDVLRFGAVTAGLAGLAVVVARAAADGPLDGEVLAAALFAAALTASLRALSALKLAGVAPQRLGWALSAVIAAPTIAWMASRVGPMRDLSPQASALAGLAGAPFADVTGPTDLALRAMACVFVMGVAGRIAAKRLSAARVVSLSKLQGR